MMGRDDDYAATAQIAVPTDDKKLLVSLKKQNKPMGKALCLSGELAFCSLVRGRYY
jgi:hypothetical protein